MAEVKKTTTKKVVKKTTEAKPAVVKKTVAKVSDKPEVKAAPKAEVVKKEEKVVKSSLSIDVYGLDGKVSGKVSLPDEIFGEKMNKSLVAQAVRVYLANQRQGNASTKTRGEVEGSTRKIYRQKGTGRARHGSVRAPIFVKGGIVFGPKPRDFGLSFPKKMKRKALYSALSAKLANGEITVLSGLESLEPKTKKFVEVIKNLGFETTKKVLLVSAAEHENVKRASNNVPGTQFTAAARLNTYSVMNAKRVILMKEAIDELKKHFLAKE